MAMLQFLNDRLKQKLPKPKFPEEYLRHVRVIDESTDNWAMQCKHCDKIFRGRAHRANCHLVGKVGEGVEICKHISKDVKHAFIFKVFPQLMEDEDVKPAAEPAAKKQKQGSMSTFLCPSNFKLASTELAKFCYTSGVSFNALRNPHLQKAFDAVGKGFTVPSQYMLEGPMLNSEDDSISAWKTDMLSTSYLAVTGDGMTNRRRVGCINVEALTKHGAVHIDTHERKVGTEAVDAEYVATIFNTAMMMIRPRVG